MTIARCRIEESFKRLAQGVWFSYMLCWPRPHVRVHQHGFISAFAPGIAHAAHARTGGWTPAQQMVPHADRSQQGSMRHLHARGVEAKRVAQRCAARGEHRQQRVRVAARQPLQPLQRGLQPARGYVHSELKDEAASIVVRGAEIQQASEQASELWSVKLCLPGLQTCLPVPWSKSTQANSSQHLQLSAHSCSAVQSFEDPKA